MVGRANVRVGAEVLAGCSLALAFGCSPFEAALPSGGDAAPDASASVEAGASDAGAPPVERDGGDLDCAGALFCTDFEGSFALESTDLIEGGGSLTFEALTAGGRGLVARMPAKPDDAGNFRAALSRELSPDVIPVVVEATLWVEKAPAEPQGEMGVLAIHAGPSASPVTATLFALNDGMLGFTVQTPGFRAFSKRGALPLRTWTDVRMEIDHAAGRYRVLTAPRGAPLSVAIDAKVTGTPPSSMTRLLAGILRYNTATPALEVWFDRLRVTRP